MTLFAAVSRRLGRLHFSLNRTKHNLLHSRWGQPVRGWQQALGVGTAMVLPMLLLTPTLHAMRPHRRAYVAHAAQQAAATNLAQAGSMGGQRYELHLHHLHTGETLDVVYRVGNTYIPGAIAKLNYFLRDHRTMQVSHYDPKEFDLLHQVLGKLGRPNGEIDIVCGYRTPWSNNFLRTRGGTASPRVTGVAEHSQHMLAKAIDIRIPGASTRAIRDAALSLHEGGVGYYPTSQFVHVDVGPVRQWSFGGHSEGM